MGFIWTLILHYQISNKQKIMAWAKQVCETASREYPNEQPIQIRNFTTSWADGLALCAICLALDPKCLDLGAMYKLPVVDRIQKSFEVSPDLGIPSLLDLDDLDDGKPDERIILTYVSYFYNAAQKPVEVKPTIIYIDHTEELEALRAKNSELQIIVTEETHELEELRKLNSALQEQLKKSNLDIDEM